MNKQSRQNGNVLFLILITIALFASLSYAISNSFRGGTDTITDEQAKVAAGDILRSMESIRQGYQYLWTQQGCSIDEISFVKAGKDINGANFEPPSPRPDDSCDVFSINGAGISYPENIQKLQTTTAFAPGIGKIFFSFAGNSINFRVNNLGTADREHMALISGIDETVCMQINKVLRYDAHENYAEESGTLIGAADTRFSGKTAGCYYNSGFIFFYVLQEF